MTNFPLLICKVHPSVLVILLVQSEGKILKKKTVVQSVLLEKFYCLVNDKHFSRSCISLLSRLTEFHYTDTDET